MFDKVFEVLWYIGLIVWFALLAFWVWLQIPVSNAYFYADSIKFSAPLYTTWSISYYTGATATNVRSNTWFILFSTLPLGSFISDTVILNNILSQQASQVFTERAYLSDCTLASYNSTIRIGTWFLCPVWRIFSDTWTSIVWEKWATWATIVWEKWATWATWGTGIQGNDGYSAFQLAQIIEWYSGTVYQWLGSLTWHTGSTWSVSFSLDLNQSWAINVSNNVTLQNQDSTLSSSGLYFSILSQKNGDTLINWQWLRNILVLVFLLFVCIFFLYRFIKKENNQL